MINFIDAVKLILEEKGLTTEFLFENNVISKNTFYKYKQHNPSLQTIIKIANFLEVSIEYLFSLSDENNFIKYSENQSQFYNTLISLIKSKNLSCREFCKQMNYSIANISRYKNGVEPNLNTLLEISNYFNCSITDLLTTEE